MDFNSWLNLRSYLRMQIADFINACLERANRADCNDADAEIARARSAIELWYHLAMAGRAPEDVADRDHLRLTGMLLRAPTAEQRSWQQ
ncbi:hypothetical protein ACWGW2_27350 [Klebsiella pneumoniae]